MTNDNGQQAGFGKIMIIWHDDVAESVLIQGSNFFKSPSPYRLHHFLALRVSASTFPSLKWQCESSYPTASRTDIRVFPCSWPADKQSCGWRTVPVVSAGCSTNMPSVLCSECLHLLVCKLVPSRTDQRASSSATTACTCSVSLES